MRYKDLLILEQLLGINYTRSYTIRQQSYPVHSKTYLQMIKSFEVVPPNIGIGNAVVSTYDNSNFGVQIQYPSDWSVQESKPSGELINLISPTGPDSNPTATVAIYMDRLHNSTTDLNNYAHLVAFTDYENFSAFKLELNTNSSKLVGRSAYTLIGTSYELHSFGLQKLMEVRTIIGDKAYMIQYIADAPRYLIIYQQYKR
jgi:hypothetical protein